MLVLKIWNDEKEPLTKQDIGSGLLLMIKFFVPGK